MKGLLNLDAIRRVRKVLSHSILAYSLLIFTLASQGTLHAAPNPEASGVPAPSLDSVLKAVLAHNGQIQESVQDIEIAKAQVAQARAAAFPHGGAVFIAAPIFKETGDALHSTADWSTWGPYLQGGIQLVQPIYTFGQISGYQRAADQQLKANTELADVKRAEILLTAKDFYYSYLMATDLEKLVDDLSGFLGEAIKTAENDAGARKKSTIKPHDVYHLKTAYQDLMQKKLAAKAGKQTAERAVVWISGSTYGSVPSKTLAPENFQPKTLDEYLAIARHSRPEFRALTAGQAARDALADAKKAQDYPILFVGGFFAGAWSPVRATQDSVFANDPFNRISGGAGVGLQLDLEFWRHSAEAAEQRAQSMKLKATEAYAAPGIELQVKRAFWEMEQAVEGLKVAEERKSLARRWFVSDGMGWSIGLTPAKDLLEALEGSGLARKNYIETVYAYNMALAKLSQAIGREVTDLHYRD